MAAAAVKDWVEGWIRRSRNYMWQVVQGAKQAAGIGLPTEAQLIKDFETMFSLQYFRQGREPNTWTTVDPEVVGTIEFGVEMFYKKEQANAANATRPTCYWISNTATNSFPVFLLSPR